MQVTFHGVRGSTPSPAKGNQRYGGNTSCVAVESPGRDPIVFDLGTGLRMWGETLPHDGSFHGHAFVTHLHWDHVQGLPFFVPVLVPGATFQVHGPSPEGRSFRECFETFCAPPFFPVRISDLPGSIEFHCTRNEAVEIGDTRVIGRSVPHVGVTNGYRLEQDGLVVTYISDHQMPADGSNDIDDGVRELCAGADLLIHDAQYTPEEFATKQDWGHCTVEYAVHVAVECGVKRLAPFHHDPSHNDEIVDCLLKGARALAGDRLDEVFAAAEGMSITL